MRNPIHVLKSLEEKASVSNYKYERLYRNLYNPEFYLLAYANIAKSQGSMTQGVDGQTLDNMSLPRINRIIESIRNRTYQPKPAKRKYIPKKNGKLRPLGITSTDDKLVQEVVRMILEAIYEPTFSNNSHGFRPKRSCHTALTQVKKNFTGVTWIVEGDIKACFDNFDPHVLVELLRKRISDEAFIGLIWKFLKAGYMEQWQYNCTYSGVPQGSGISPLCANIYLNELDIYMQEYKEMLICIACRIAAIMLFLIYQDKGVEHIMFSENLKTLRKQKGFSQEELATRLHVVRQTISKWEKNLSVPDADTLIRLAEILEVSVSELLGTKIENENVASDVAEQLSRINEQLAIKNRRSRRIWKIVAIILAVIVLVNIFIAVFFSVPDLNSNTQNNQPAISDETISIDE